MLINSPADLARYYRDQRKQRDISQTAVAEDTAMRQDTVSTFENRPNNVRLDTLFCLLSALDLEMHLVQKNTGLTVTDKNKGWKESW